LDRQAVLLTIDNAGRDLFLSQLNRRLSNANQELLHILSAPKNHKNKVTIIPIELHDNNE
jgi:hypothetical protein